MFDKQLSEEKVDYEFKISSRLIRLGNAINRYRNLLAGENELTSTQSSVLAFILNQADREMTASDLMQYLNLSQSTVAGLLDRLSEKGFITKTKHPQDSRKTILMPSEKGLELGKFLFEVQEQTEEALLEGLSAQERVDFERYLQIALTNMNKLRYTDERSS